MNENRNTRWGSEYTLDCTGKSSSHGCNNALQRLQLSRNVEAPLVMLQEKEKLEWWGTQPLECCLWKGKVVSDQRGAPPEPLGWPTCRKGLQTHSWGNTALTTGGLWISSFTINTSEGLQPWTCSISPFSIQGISPVCLISKGTTVTFECGIFLPLALSQSA